MDAVETSLLARNPWIPRRPITVAEYHREVANSSLNYDRVVKRSLHARHGIAEFGIVNLTA